MRIPYYPSRESRVKKLLEVFEPKSGVKIIDLGSGDGRILRILSSKYDDIYLYGVEKDKVLFDISNKLSKGYGNIKIFNGDLFHVDISRYDIVYTYLTSDALKRLRDRAEDFLSRGGTWIALDYSIPGIKPRHIIKLDGWHKYYIYYFEKPRGYLKV